MVDRKDPPIQPQNFLGGVNVVHIEDIRVARGFSRRPHSACQHKKMVYDGQERRVWCEDCETNIEAFDAFRMLVEHFDHANHALERRETALKEAETFQARALAIKVLDTAWRKRETVPACPHCHNGLFPEDFKNGIGTTLGRDYAEARRGKAQDSNR